MRTLLPVVAVLPFLAAAEPTAPPLHRERVVELPGVQGRIDHLAVDASSRRLFVAALGNDTVEVIDLAAGRRLHTIRGLAEPQGVLVVPERRRLFVANRRDGTLRVFDATTFAEIAAVRLGADADNLRRDGERVWVGYGDGALAAFDFEGRKLAVVPLAGHPESFQVESNGGRIFVNVPDAHQVAVVDREKASVIATWPTGAAAANYPMALDEAAGRVYVVCRRPARLLAFAADSGKLLSVTPTVGDADDVFFDAAKQRLYVTGGEGAIAVLRRADGDRWQEVARLPTSAGARTSLFSAELGRLFLAVRRQGAAAAAIWEYPTAP